jgi:hypothetical protein
MNGPLVLSSCLPAHWVKARNGKLYRFFKQHHIGKAQFEDPVYFEDDGDALLLPTGTETAWHSRTWGGYLVRMIQLENVIAQEAAASWKPDGIQESAWKRTGIRLRVQKALYLVDLGIAHSALPKGSLKVKLSPGVYMVDVADDVHAEKGRIFQVIRLRAEDAVIPSVSKSHSPENEKEVPVTSAHVRLARSLKLAESEGGPILVISGDMLPCWRGDETDDYDRACNARDERRIKVTSGTGIIFASPDLTGFLQQGDNVIIYRQLGVDDPAQAIAMALAVPERRWKKTKVTIHVGKSKTLYAIDSVLDGKILVKKKRLGDSATRIQIQSGKYRLETVGEIQTAKNMFELHRLVHVK